MPWMMPYLRYVDDSLKSSFQESLSLMRKNRLFCDVILHVSSAASGMLEFDDGKIFLHRLKTPKFMHIAMCWLAFHLIWWSFLVPNRWVDGHVAVVAEQLKMIFLHCRTPMETFQATDWTVTLQRKVSTSLLTMHTLRSWKCPTTW